MSFEEWLKKFRAENPYHCCSDLSLKIGWEGAVASEAIKTAEPQWLPIEDAPKDGTILLLWDLDGMAFCGFYEPRDKEWVLNVANICLNGKPVFWQPINSPRKNHEQRIVQKWVANNEVKEKWQLERLEIEPANARKDLFNVMTQDHNVTLLESELDNIIFVVLNALKIKAVGVNHD